MTETIGTLLLANLTPRRESCDYLGVLLDGRLDVLDVRRISGHSRSAGVWVLLNAATDPHSAREPLSPADRQLADTMIEKLLS